MSETSPANDMLLRISLSICNLTNVTMTSEPLPGLKQLDST